MDLNCVMPGTDSLWLSLSWRLSLDLMLEKQSLIHPLGGSESGQKMPSSFLDGPLVNLYRIFEIFLEVKEPPIV